MFDRLKEDIATVRERDPAARSALEFSTWQHTLLASLALPDSLFTLLLAVGYGLMWVSVVLTVISGIQYVWTYRKYLTA